MWKNGSTARTTSSATIPCSGRICATLATRLRWVSITPLGLPVVPELYGSTARCDDGAKLDIGRGQSLLHQVGGVGMTGDSWPVAVEHDEVAVGQPDRCGGLFGLRQQRCDRDQHLGVRIGQLLGDVLGGEQRVDGGGRRAGAQDAVEGDRESRTVRRQQADDVADTDAAAGQRPGERVDAVDHLAVGGLPAGLRVDQGDPVEVGLVDAVEQKVVDAGGWDVDFGERAREAHGPRSNHGLPVAGSSFVELLDELLGRDHPKRRVDQFGTSSQSTFFVAVRSRPSQPDGPR